MFATFTSTMDAQTAGSRTSTQTVAKPKRNRACERCRSYRIRCDNGRPCQNCRTRGTPCSKEVSVAIDQQSSVNRDLEILRARVAELENRHTPPEQPQLPVSSAGTSAETVPAVTVAVASAQSSASGARPPSPPGTWVSSPTIPQRLDCARSWQWPGVWVSQPRVDQPQYHGPTSPNHLAYRLGTYLSWSSEQQSQLGGALQSLCYGRATAGSDASLGGGQTDQALNSGGAGGDFTPNAGGLTRQQEEYLLSSFWQSYHATTPIVNETELRKHYDALWAPMGRTQLEPGRKSSPLVDIILALCMQHSAAPQPASTRGHRPSRHVLDSEAEDVALQGRWLFERCQTLLQPELDTPSLVGVQCYIYSTIYLINLSTFDAARRMLSSVMHAAYAMALNFDPPDYLSEPQKALSRRIWWTIVYLDTTLSLHLGRPFLIHINDVTTEIPDSDRQEAALGGANTTIYEDISLLSYNTQSIKLMLAYRKLRATYTHLCNDVMSAYETNAVYDHPALIEACAALLAQNMQPIKEWIKNVPLPLKLTRKDTGESFSLMRSPVEIGTFIPPWLQRQRVLLELSYHNLIMSLHRPFIRFPPLISTSTAPPTPTADGHAISAISHALVTVKIIHQVVIETDLLNSWHTAYKYLWEAALTLVAFSIVRPLCPFTVSARKALSTAVDTFEIFHGYGFTAASGAASLVRVLNAAIDDKVQSMRAGIASSGPQDANSYPSCSSSTPSLIQDVSSERTSIRSASLHYQQSMRKLPQLGGDTSMADIVDNSGDIMTTEMLEGFDDQNDVLRDEDWEAYLGLWVEDSGRSEKPVDGVNYA